MRVFVIPKAGAPVGIDEISFVRKSSGTSDYFYGEWEGDKGVKISFELKGASLAPGEGNENDNQDIVGKTDNQLAIIIILAAITVVLVVFIILRKRLARKIENVGEVAENSTKGKIYLTNEEKPRGGNRKYLEAIMLLEEDYEASFLDEEVYVELREKYIDIYKKESFRK